MILAGIIIGEVAHLGPRLRRRGPRSADARLARRSRRGSASDIVESTLESCENGLQMLHLNMRCYLSHIAETTAFLRSIDQKPFIVSMAETFLNKGIEHVELEGYQVLVRRDREGQWGGGVLVFVLDEYAPE